MSIPHSLGEPSLSDRGAHNPNHPLVSAAVPHPILPFLLKSVESSNVTPSTVSTPYSPHRNIRSPLNSKYGCCFHRSPPTHPWLPLLNPRYLSHQSTRSLPSALIQLLYQLIWVSRHPSLLFRISSTTSMLIWKMLLSSAQSTHAGVL